MKPTTNLIASVEFPSKDYVSPGFERVRPDACFPNMEIGNTNDCDWPYLRRTGQHNWYRDKRVPATGFVNRDEAHILYNTALIFEGKAALEVGCFLGWSACHLALGGVKLDIIDPNLGNPDFVANVTSSLTCAGVFDNVKLYSGSSPAAVIELATRENKKWDLLFIDGNHDFPGPVNDSVVCERFCAENSMVLFHDLLSPEVAEGLQYFRYRGWKTRVYYTSQIMGVAWRGNIEPLNHIPDPNAHWEIPEHLRDYPSD